MKPLTASALPTERRIFDDRRDAGRKLATIVTGHRWRSPVVLALPRGGVPVAFEIAQAIGAPLDVLIVRKLNTPGREELAAGAIAEDDAAVLNQDVLANYDVTSAQLDQELQTEAKELTRRANAYRNGCPMIDLAGHDVIVVDDGLATGATAEAALRRARRERPHRLFLAVPVATRESCRRLDPLTDGIMCVKVPPFLNGVGEWYGDFHQTSDVEVVELLARSRVERTRAQGDGGSAAD